MNFQSVINNFQCPRCRTNAQSTSAECLVGYSSYCSCGHSYFNTNILKLFLSQDYYFFINNDNLAKIVHRIYIDYKIVYKTVFLPEAPDWIFETNIMEKIEMLFIFQ